MNTTEITPNHILVNAHGSTTLEQPMRVLSIWPMEDTIWLIEMPRKHADLETRMRSYRRGPQARKLSEVLEHVRADRILPSDFAGRAVLALPDDKILEGANTKRKKKQLQKTLNDRDERWKALLPILSGTADGKVARSFDELIRDAELPQKIRARAIELGKAPSTMYSLLNLYFALGSRMNSVCSNLWRCGCPGKPKPQYKKLGRRTRLFANKEQGPGRPLTAEDKRRLGHGYRLVNHQVSLHDAYILCSGMFWGKRTISAEGESTIELWPKDCRPSFAQFKYWGAKENSNKSVAELVLGPAKWDQKARARAGSLQDQVGMVCQLSYFDGTSTDVYLTSMRSRLLKLPPAFRLVLKEARTELIYGLYCGWEPPSARTALLTILHGAQSKVEFCRRFGVHITDDQWPSFLARTHQADNGELKGTTPTEAEAQFGFSIEYTQARRGDKKGGIESQHREDHENLDHKLEGTTFGRQRERGEEHPAVLGLWNYREYMRELIEAILEHNNEEVLELAPLAMLKECPHLHPTRLNIFNWLREHGMSAEKTFDAAALRAFMLPDQPAVIRKNGVYLMAEINGTLQLVPKLRYRSAELVATGILSRVKLSGETIRTTIKLARADLRHAWMATSAGMIPLELASNDSLLREQMSLDEWCNWLEELALERDRRCGAKEQSKLSKLLRRASVSAAARSEQRKEVKERAKPPSKAELVQNLRFNRDVERILLANQDAPEVPVATVVEHPDPASQARPSAAYLAMRNFKQAGADDANH